MPAIQKFDGLFSKPCPKTYNPVSPQSASSGEGISMTEHLPMEIAVREENGIHLLEVRGRLTIGEPAEQLNQALQTIVDRGGRKVVINLNGVPQIDSSGISSLVR